MATGRENPGVAELRARTAELERERELLNAIANHAPSLLCLVDADGRVRPFATNIAFEQTLGYDPSESGGDLFWELYVPAGDAAAVREAIEETIRDGTVTERDGRWLTKGGEVIDVAWSCTPLPMIESGPVYLICGTDITERKRHEAEVRTSRSRIVAAADDARRRLERNLHDGAQQRLVVLLLSLRGARTKAGDDAGLVQLLDGVIDELSGAMQELRELARGIHPVALTKRGLPAAIRVLADRAPLTVELSLPADRYSGARGGDGVLRRRRGAHEHRQVRAGVEGDRAHHPRSTTGCSWTSRTTASAVRTPRPARAWAASPTALQRVDGVFTVDSEPDAGTRVHAEIPLG